ncbi:MAG: DEAD/DEAH box helicase family protein [Bacteriovoracaceae bacterium]|nr:DEAD/DEAH box helicase family protein [Bacteriovoracaceae bacterium]
MNKLKKWAVIDIETTGIDPAYDKIIDLGFLQFEGTQLVRSYSSLVRTDQPVSKFIQKLTGITEGQIKNAPVWKTVENELQTLKDHQLIAHNALFEEKFLKKYLDAIESEEGERFHDSMLFLALLFPEKNSLNLEGFLIELGIKEKEDHRGLEDSKDLLKAMLTSCWLLQKDPAFYVFIKELCSDFDRADFWFKDFLELDITELNEIAEQIDFDLEETAKAYAQKKLEASGDNGEEALSRRDINFSGQNIQNILQDEAALSRHFPGYKYRQAQEEMSLRVGQAFNNNIHALIQAPTGTGKTMGYLLPSTLLTKSKDEQVLISTGTKTLQNQAVQKDIPQIYKVLGLNKSELSVIRLFGSKNHLCELKFRNQEHDDLLGQMDGFEEKFAKAYIETILFFNQRTPDYNHVLTRENIPFVLKRLNKTLSEQQETLAVDFRACTGNKCPFSASCTYLQGLRRAKEANLIVGNHSLLLNWPRGFDRPKYVVVDEAHKMEGEVTNAFTMELAQKDLEKFAKNLPQMMGPLFYLLGNVESGKEELIKEIRSQSVSFAQMLSDHAVPLQESIERLARQLPRFTDIYWNETPMVKKQSLNNALESAIYNHVESLAFILKSIYDLLAPFSDRWDISKFGDDDNKLTAWSAFESSFSQIEEAQSVFNAMVSPSEKMVNSIKFHEEFGYVFNCAPIDTGELLYESVLKEANSVVFTSATLANQEGTKGMASVEWMTGYKYLDAERRFKTGLFLNNKFDYENNAKVFVSSDSPQIYEQTYVDEVLEKIIPVIKSIGGKTLLLFSAKTRFERAIEILLSKLENEMPLFIQGMGNQVVEDFKNTSGGVLIGMESFGEGIDVPGDALKLIYVDKIPDLRRDLVVDSRRDFYARSFGNEFVDYFLAHRCRSLHQKLGRLIRRENDSGAIILTDPRIKRWKGQTLKTFREMMRPYELEFMDLEQACLGAEEFINGRD